MKRIYYIIIIFVSLIVLYFNTIFILNTDIILHGYEHSIPNINNEEIVKKRVRELKMHYYLSIAVYIACFLGIGGSIYRLVNPKKADS